MQDSLTMLEEKYLSETKGFYFPCFSNEESLEDGDIQLPEDKSSELLE